MSMMWCDNCKAEVIPTKKFNWIVFILLFCCTWVLWIFYLIYYLVKRPDTCPRCGQKAFLRYAQPAEKQIPQSIPVPASTSVTQKINYCPNCGSPVSGRFCENCGTEL